MKMTAAQALIKILKANGTEIVFGYPGAAVSPVYQALKKEPLRHVLARTEQGAAHMAASLYRTTGKTGVCLATSGPGSTNLLTAIANAYMDSVPLVAITAQVSVSQIGTDAFQEVDTTGVTAPVTKHNYLIKSAEDLPQAVHEAFYLARTGRPGPVVIDIPFDVLNTRIQWQETAVSAVRGYHVATEPDSGALNRLTQAVAAAKRPLLVVGGGVVSAGSQRAAADLMKAAGLPAVSTMMGLSALPTDCPGFLGMTGVHGDPAANEAYARADLLIFAGARITERTVPDPARLAGRAVTVHIDIDPAELGKNCACDITVCADVKETLLQLTDRLRGYRAPADWCCALAALKEAERADTGSRPAYVDPAQLLRALRRRLTAPAVIASEVGQHQIWTCRHFPFKAGDIFLTSGGFGAMGYGLPAAIGAKIAAPDKTVIAIEGDGSFQMSMPELATMMENRAAVKIILFKNNCLGLVRETERAACRAGHVYLSDYPNFCALAAAYGIPARRLTRNEDIGGALDALLAEEGAFFLEVHTDPRAHT